MGCMKDTKGLRSGLFQHYAVQLREIAKLPGTSVLEVGPRAVVHDYLVWSGYEVTTLDIDPTRKPDVVGDILDGPFDDGEFDIVLCADVLEHISDERVPYAIKHFHRIADSMVVSVPWRREVAFSLSLKIPKLKKRTLVIPVAKRPLCQGHEWELEGWDDVQWLAWMIHPTRTFRVRNRQYFISRRQSWAG